MDNEVAAKINRITKKIFRASVFKVTGIYILANFANASIPFFLMPVLTKYLTPADYGFVAIFGVLLGLFTPVIGVNTSFAISVKYFKINKETFPAYVANSLLITVGSCLVVIIFFSIFQSQIEKLSDFPREWLWAVIVVCFSANITAILFVILQAMFNTYNYVILQLSRTALSFGLSILFVVWLNMSWQGYISAQVVTNLFFAGISLYSLFHKSWLTFQYNIDYIKDVLKFGMPLLPNSLANFILLLADRFIIVKLIGLSEAGIYAVGVQFAMVISLIMNSLDNAYTPWLYNKLNSITEDEKSKIVLMTYAYIIGMIILTVVISKFIPIIFAVFIDARFWDAFDIIFWACLAQVFGGAVNVVGKYIHYVEKTHMVLLANIPCSIFHLPFCYLMVSENGIVGAAQAATVVYFIRFLIFWIISNKIYPMPWVNFYQQFYNNSKNKSILANTQKSSERLP
jgi:O-antigen/teichoic acid export membrane protein